MNSYRQLPNVNIEWQGGSHILYLSWDNNDTQRENMQFSYAKLADLRNMSKKFEDYCKHVEIDFKQGNIKYSIYNPAEVQPRLSLRSSVSGPNTVIRIGVQPSVCKYLEEEGVSHAVVQRLGHLYANHSVRVPEFKVFHEKAGNGEHCIILSNIETVDSDLITSLVQDSVVAALRVIARQCSDGAAELVVYVRTKQQSESVCSIKKQGLLKRLANRLARRSAPYC